jgi:peptide deformylase
MPPVKVLCYPNEVLKHKAAEVTDFDDSLRKTATEMLQAMYAANGVGLAAPQVGLSARMTVLNCSGKPEDELVLVNPEIVDSQGKVVAEEGCLSFPGIYIKVQRAEAVKVRYQDLEGQEHVLEADGLLARAVQHELDHLDGVLLSDRMNPVQRMAHRRALRMLELRQADSEPAAAE